MTIVASLSRRRETLISGSATPSPPQPPSSNYQFSYSETRRRSSRSPCASQQSLPFVRRRRRAGGGDGVEGEGGGGGVGEAIGFYSRDGEELGGDTRRRVSERVLTKEEAEELRKKAQSFLALLQLLTGSVPVVVVAELKA